MKVLHIIPSISPLRGGPSQAVIQMVKALRQEGVDASIVTTHDNGIYRNSDLPTGKWVIYEDVPVLLHSCIDSKNRSIREYLISISFVKWMISNMAQYDLIHFHAIFSFSSTIGMILARRKGIPYIVRTIGQLNSWSLSQGFLKKKLMLDLIERGNLNHAKAIHVTSDFEQKDLALVGCNNSCFVLGLGVDFQDKEADKGNCLHVDQEKVRFLYLSRIHPKKQIELLFESFSLLRNELYEAKWELIIAGTGERDYLDELKRTAARLNIEKNLIWSGHVSGEGKQKLLRDSDWFVLTSASENFGISVVEAMASSLPVIISKNIGISEKVLQYNAGYVCHDNTVEITKVLIKALNRIDIHKMRLGARKLVEQNFSWKEIGRTLATIYHDLSKPLS